MCGYSNKFSIQQLNEEDIEYIETFARFKLITLIGMDTDKKIKKHFFGVYVDDITNFRFSPAERQMIASIASHVSSNDLATDQIDVSKEWATANKKFFDNAKDENKTEFEAPSKSISMLCKLLSAAKINSSRSKHGYRYTPEMIRFCAYIRSLAGPLAYNTLQINLPGILPSIQAINRYIYRPDFLVVEGLLRCEELLVYLRKRNLPLWVSLSEDGTRIENRAQYDSRTNQIIGFVQPIDVNGMPESFTYKARTAMEILQYFADKTPISNSVNTVMAKPFGTGEAFCLLIFGTDNQYTARDVANRWQFITKELNRIGIGVLTIASDSDPKFNCAMRNNSKLGCDSKMINPFFKCSSNSDGPYYFQDAPHIVTKLRNRLLKTSDDKRALQFGPRDRISISHLQHLIDNVRKDQHMLTETIISPNDRQNYDSAVRICDEQAINALRCHVPKSEATIVYLEIMSSTIKSYMDEKMSPLERVEKVWYSLFIVRIWRYFIKNHPSLTLKNNFLSSNCFSCLEQNAHSIVLIILFLKEKGLPQLFAPSYFNSQPCEHFYRQIRSLSTTYSTVVSCSVKEILNRISKIQLLDEISNDSNLSFNLTSIFTNSSVSKETVTCLENSISYFKKKRDLSNSKIFELPSKVEIIGAIEKSRDKAIELGLKFGLIKNNKKTRFDSCICNIPFHTIQAYKLPLRDPNEIDIRNAELLVKLGLNKNLRLKNYAPVELLDDNSPFCEIPFCKKTLICRKNQWCWFLSKASTKLSSDRLLRVRTCVNSKKKRKIKTKKGKRN